MKISVTMKKLIFSAIFIILLVAAVPFAVTAENYSASITVQTDKQNYYIREPINVTGTFTRDGQPVTDGLVAMEIRDPDPTHLVGFAYRTVPIGNPQESYFTVETTLTDKNGKPVSVAKAGQGRLDLNWLQLTFRVTNNMLNVFDITLAYTIYDNNLIPLWSFFTQFRINGQTTVNVTDPYVEIPQWAKPGKAMISTNIYGDFPSNGGMPYMPEKLDYFDIVINKLQPLPYSQMPASYETQAGQYRIFLRASPDYFALSGNYSVYVSGEANATAMASASTTFSVLAYPAAPRASFTSYPPTIYENMTYMLYENMTATFEASSSSAEGYHDDIKYLEWTIDDPSNPQHVNNSWPTWNVTHYFSTSGMFNVNLTVSDKQGLWSTTIKPITINPESGPTANFTWKPFLPYPHTVVVFNSSSSKPGWRKQTGGFSPIAYYTWSFSDDPNNVTTTGLTVNHQFQTFGNYTVILTATDVVGRSGSITKNMTVLNYTSFPWDVTGDGYVGIDDIYMVAIHFGLSVGDPGWDPKYDITGDGYIGIDDIFEVAMHFGEEAP
jgi:hypothetical protein